VAPDDGNAPTWVQIAEGGPFLGHPQGAFDVNDALVDEVIRNFRAHPSFKAGPDGYGTTRIVQYDFKHAAEQPASAIAVAGAPAQAWVLDLEKRTGPNGNLQLWALTDWLEPARTYVREGRYQWTSMAVWPHSKHPVTAQDIGWYLSSVALTNDPFIQGMVPIAAERSGRPLSLELDSLEDVTRELRWALGLGDLCGAPEVLAELAKLRAMMMGGEAPAGVDLDDVVGKFRRMLNLPTLSDSAAVMAELDKLTAMLVAESAAKPEPAVGPGGGQMMSSQMPAATLPPTVTNRNPDIMADNVLKLFAERFRIPVDEAGVTKAVLAELDKGANAQTQLSAILGALQVEDQGGAMQKIIDLIKNSSALLEAMPQLAELKDAKIKSEEKAVEQDVEQAMAAHRIPDAAKEAMLFTRTGGVTLTSKSPAEDWQRRESARSNFLAKYPLPRANEQHLLTSLATHRPVMGSITNPQNPPPPPGAGKGNTTLESIQACAGVNITAKAMAFVRSQPGGDKLSHEDAHANACALLAEIRGQGVRLPPPPGRRFEIPGR
jgi:hypothetical protein